MEKLTGQQLQVPEVTQSEEGQRNKLRIVLGYANRVLGLNRSQAKWSVDSVHTKNIVSILHLLVRADGRPTICLLDTSPSLRDRKKARMPSSA